MKRFSVILLIMLVILTIVIYAVYSYRDNMAEIQKLNREYEAYYNIEVLGTELISIINRTIDINHKNEIERDSNQYYIDNEKNSIQIYIQFVYKNEVKKISMEDVEKTGSEAFIRVYSTASFKCTNIEYHTKTKNVKSLTFEEMTQSN